MSCPFEWVNLYAPTIEIGKKYEEPTKWYESFAGFIIMGNNQKILQERCATVVDWFWKETKFEKLLK